MRAANFASIVPASLPSQFPIHLEQRGANAGPLIMLALVVPAAVALLTPFAALAVAAVSDPAVQANLADNPAAAVQLLLTFTVLSILFGWPAKRLADQLSRTRTVHIGGGRVSVEDRSLLSTRVWNSPLDEYTGIEHRVRSSLSGIRHELILSHPDRNRNVLLALAPRISEREIAEARELLATYVPATAALYGVLAEAYGIAGTRQIRAANSHAA